MGPLVAAGAVFMFASLLASSYGLVNASLDANSQAVARNPIFVGMVGYSSCFLWSAIEGFVHHRNARKRMALGLADPVVTNRFFVWACSA